MKKLILRLVRQKFTAFWSLLLLWSLTVSEGFAAESLLVLDPQEPPGPAQLVFANKIGTKVDAPVFLPDGRGAGAIATMTAQLFLVDSTVLTPLEPRTSFRTEPVPVGLAYILSKDVVPPGKSSGDIAILRFRVWDSAKGSYEEAQAGGGYYGESEVTMTLGGGREVPSNLVGLSGFILRRADTLVIDGATSEGLSFHLESPEPKTYSLESSPDLTTWIPFETIQVTGTNQVTLPVMTGNKFFRAVLLN